MRVVVYCRSSRRTVIQCRMILRVMNSAVASANEVIIGRHRRRAQQGQCTNRCQNQSKTFHRSLLLENRGDASPVLVSLSYGRQVKARCVPKTRRDYVSLLVTTAWEPKI